MQNEIFLRKIRDKIKKELNPEHISIIDNSDLHFKHKFFDPKKFHLKLEIKSKKLKSMKKIDAHKAVFSILKDELNTSIHALEIEIK